MAVKLAIIVIFSLMSVSNIDATDPTNGTTSDGSTSHVQPTTPSSRNTDYWFVYESSSRPSPFCVMMTAQIYITLTTNKTETTYIQMNPNNTRADGSCGDIVDTIELKQSGMTMTFTFSKKAPTDNSYSTSLIVVDYSGHSSLNITNIPSWLNNLDSNKHYTCNKNDTLFAGEWNPTEQIQINFAQLQIEAFRNSTDEHILPTATSCDPDNLIPIIVGAALGGLIIIVLIAYLVGRQRSRRGYESV